MNFSILTLTKVWGIKYRVLKSVDSESERILRIGPSQEGGARGGAKMNFYIFTSTKVWGIKCRVLNSVDTESGRI